MLAINLLTTDDLLEIVKNNFKQKRLSINLTQQGLASKSGVSLGSIKRFETHGHISLESLLKVALVLECLDDFKELGNRKTNSYKTMDELISCKPIRKRGKLK